MEQLTRGVEKELAKPLAKEREKRRNAEQAAEEAFMAKQRALCRPRAGSAQRRRARASPPRAGPSAKNTFPFG